MKIDSFSDDIIYCFSNYMPMKKSYNIKNIKMASSMYNQSRPEVTMTVCGPPRPFSRYINTQ